VRHALPILAVLALAIPAAADEVLLVGGGKVRGRVIERTDTHLVIEVGPGRITLPRSQVVAVESGATALDAWHQRSLRLAPDDADGWLSLGLWAREQGLHTQAREAFGRVLVLRPDDPIANTARGRVRQGDRWVSEEESYRARGFVRNRGRWITAEEHALELAERRADAEERVRRAEADARVRAAEARARDAEARAQAAENAATAFPGPWSPSPYGLVIGTGIGRPLGHRPRGHRSHLQEPPPPPEPRRRPVSRTSSFR
jgi:hypothetical protein